MSWKRFYYIDMSADVTYEVKRLFKKSSRAANEQKQAQLL